ncbi:MAG: DEAD/DEAH box helicase [Bacteroidia bacterium]|nr:DEAD/DEAH box helicase [Bacteroidia bacterium]
MKFEKFRIQPEIIRSLEKLNFKKPTDIQYKAIPAIQKGEDVLAIAQTGTGKTAAFAIPIIDMIQENKTSKRSEGLKCVVMVPTHELAIQIKEVFEEIGQHTLVKTYAIFGGVEQDRQIQKLQAGLDVLIATPGRLFDLVSQRYLNLGKVEILVLDEADHMLDLGFYKDIQDLLRFLPRKRQTLFFSATINEKIKKLAYSLVKNAIRIQISPKNPVAKNIDHAMIYVDMDEKRFILERIVKEHESSKILVFVRTKVRAERVMKAMERVGIKSLTLHGDKDQKDRMKVMKTFQGGGTRVLIATDVSARGIDISGIAYVINYDLPEQAENYVHRVGRTGRGRERGQALSFCSEHEKELLVKIEEFLGHRIKVLEYGKGDQLETKEMSLDASQDWRTVMQEIEQEDKKRKKRKKK